MQDIRPISNALAAKARDELFEVPERIAEDIEIIRAWINKQPHLRSRVDGQFIITFLRGCKYSLERTKEKIDMFYTMRTAIPELFEKRDPLLESNLQILRLGFGVPLPMTNGDDGPRIMLIRPGVYDVSKFRVEDIMRVSTMINDILMLEDDHMVIAGQVGILDLSNVTMGHFLQYTPAFVKKMTMLSQEGSPLRQKGFHYIHTPSGFETVFNMFKGFMSEKNRKRLYVHGDNLESFFEYIPRKLLPMEYGGDAGPIQNIINEWERKIVTYSEFFRNESLYGTDERKRVGTRKTPESLFGIDGSFRKLNVD